ncbi:GNAT family N-acetyltransferase [Lactococcus termiticola]|uniref:N-acetyltransferase n=1 Tax=Lactococcus termiticola TaxID=2169526 RepID=A0A2R5HDX8_9LACT|nr:GNAT family N-acetyltransferase [Lactococcus termiticola]GBG96273.1 N-acetyltransferase [Lactococcus termiticola]
MDLYLYQGLARYNIIESGRLLLRPFAMSDVDDMYVYASRPENLTFVFPPHQSKDETAQAIVQQFMKAPLGHWAIELKADHRMIGSINFIKIDQKRMSAEIGYVLNMDYWGLGLVAEALKTLVVFSFEQFGLKTLIIKVDKENQASKSVALKAGFQFHKAYKATNQYTGQIRDFEEYQLRKRDYDETSRNTELH